MASRYFILILLTVCFSKLVVGQNINGKDSLSVKIFLKKKIENNNDLLAKIIVKNTSNIPISVYKDLEFGDFIGNQLFVDHTNFALDLEEKKGSKFTENSLRSFIDFAYREEDTLNDRKKILLAAKDSITYFFHVDEISGFKKGNHRIRCFYSNLF